MVNATGRPSFASYSTSDTSRHVSSTIARQDESELSSSTSIPRRHHLISSTQATGLELPHSANLLRAENLMTISQLINHESQSRLLLDRLHILAEQLCELRLQCLDLGEHWQLSSSPSIRSSIAILIRSISQLEPVVHDLGHRIATLPSMTPSPINSTGFQPSTRDSLLARGRAVAEATNTGQVSRQLSTLQASVTLQERLSAFSNHLTHLNLRLDRVAQNYQEIQWLDRNNPTEIYTAPQNSGAIQNALETSPVSIDHHGNTTAEPLNDDMHYNTSGRSGSFELSPEELELQSRVAQLSEQGSRTSSALTSGEAGLLQIGRRELNFQAREINDRVSIRTSLRDSRHSAQNSSLPNLIPHSGGSFARIASTSVHTSDISLHEIDRGDDAQNGLRNVPELQKPVTHKFLSSHVPLSKARTSIFFDGTEYRDCLGLWLSQNGQAMPTNGLPLSS